MANRRRLMVGFLAAALIAVAARPMLSGFVRSSLYPAPPVHVPSPPPPPLEEVALELDDAPLSAWWLPAAGDDAPVALLLHGNGENLETLRRSGFFDRFARLGAAILALDYPGYGRSAGTPSEAALAAATRRAWSELVERAGDHRPRAVIGWSLGAAAAARLAADLPGTVDALVLVSPWTTLAEVAAVHYPAWLTGPLLGDRFDNLAAAGAIRSPALVVHGELDSIVPVGHGRRVFAALAEPKRWVEVEGAGHNDLFARDETWRAIAGTLDRARRGR